MPKVIRFFVIFGLNTALLAFFVLSGLVALKLARSRSLLVGIGIPDLEAMGAKRKSLSSDPDEFKCFSSHPYFGYVETCLPGDQKGFLAEHSLTENISYGNQNKFRLLILGGSVATHLSRRASVKRSFENAIYRSKLRKKFTGGVEVFNAALGGYKQPQQLNILSFLLLQGYRFDAVVNLAGFNEIALPLAENFPKGHSLVLPRSQPERELRDAVLFDPYSFYLPISIAINLLPSSISGHIFSELVRGGSNAIKIRKPYSFDRPGSYEDASDQAFVIYKNSVNMSYALARLYQIVKSFF